MKKQAKQNEQNRQKAAKNKYYLQMVNQLRRNVFNLDLKREIVAAKTNVKHFFLFNSHLVSIWYKLTQT